MSHDLLNPAAASRYFLEQLREGEHDRRGDESSTRRPQPDEAHRHDPERLDLLEAQGDAELAVAADDLGASSGRSSRTWSPTVRGAGMSVEGPPAGVYPAEVNPIFANVVVNLVGNAVKYAAGGKRIAVGIADGGAEWVLSVRDWGKGSRTRTRRASSPASSGSARRGSRAPASGSPSPSASWSCTGEDPDRGQPRGGRVFLVSVRKAAGAAAAPGGAPV